MKAFVTGGTGAVGKAFLPKLLAAGYQVTALTRDPNKTDLFRHENLKYFPGDLSDAETLRRLLVFPGRFDVVYHLAASLDYFGIPDQLMKTNAGGTAAMAQFARNARVSRFVYASSVEASGAFRSHIIPVSPDYQGRPLTAYGASKLVAEEHTMVLKGDGILPICLRIGNVYGPGWNNFIIDFASSLLDRGMLWEYLHLFGDRYWSPVWNDDVADGLIASGVGTHCGIENLVGQAATVKEMFHFCADAMNIPFSCGRVKISDWFYQCFPLTIIARIFRRGGKGDFPYMLIPKWPNIHRCSGMEDSSRRLGWKPRMHLRKGIRETLLWARSTHRLKF